jgi:sulfur transfer protein SufE
MEISRSKTKVEQCQNTFWLVEEEEEGVDIEEGGLQTGGNLGK